MSRRVPGTNTGNFDEIARRLTERDFAIIEMLAKHKIMTAGMLEALFFPMITTSTRSVRVFQS